jgi:hypothetical protein
MKEIEQKENNSQTKARKVNRQFSLGPELSGMDSDSDSDSDSSAGLKGSMAVLQPNVTQPPVKMHRFSFVTVPVARGGRH